MRKNEKVIGLIKDELGGQIMNKFVALRAKTYGYLKANNDEDKKVKGTKEWVMKKNLNFRDYKNFLKTSRILDIKNYLEREEIDIDCLKEVKKELTKNRLILKTQQRFKHERTEEINKIEMMIQGHNQLIQ